MMIKETNLKLNIYAKLIDIPEQAYTDLHNT